MTPPRRPRTGSSEFDPSSQGGHRAPGRQTGYADGPLSWDSVSHRGSRPAASSNQRSDAGDRAAHPRTPRQNPGGRGERSQGEAHNAYSRRVSQQDYADRRKRQKRKRIMIGAACAIVAVLVGCGAFAWAYVSDITNRLHEGVDDSLISALDDEVKPGEPFYMLLMGVDRSQERADSAEYEGDTFRSDSMILARIDPQQQKVTLISLHRDTLIDMGEHGWQKLNSAHAIGGPAYAVEVVSKFAGVPISHYAEIDFDGFKAVVDALGGVDVDVPMEIDDADAGGYVPAGEQTLTGDQALILARARNAYNDYGDGDVYRAANQRLVIGAIARKILASDPVTMASTVSAAAGYVTTDMTVDEIISVAKQLKGMDTSSDIYSIMEPTTPTYENGGWYEYVNQEAWDAMMDRVRQGLPPAADEDAYKNEGGVTDGSLDKDYVASSAMSESDSSSSAGSSGTGGNVTVLNGSGVGGAASTVASQLEAAGYTVPETGDADSYGYSQTLVIYNDADQESAARAIAEAIGVGAATLNDGSYDFEGDFLVIVGTDY